MKAFQPDLIIISAGFDSAEGDPLGGVGVTPVGYAYMTNGMKKICSKIVAVLEGGYDLRALEVSTEAVVRTLQLATGDQEGFDNLIASLSNTPGLTSNQLEIGSMINVREQFK